MLFSLKIGRHVLNGLIGLDLKLYWVVYTVADALNLKSPWNFAKNNPFRYLGELISEKFKKEIPHQDHKFRMIEQRHLEISLQKSKKKGSKFLYNVLCESDFFVSVVSNQRRFPRLKLCTEENENAIHFKRWLDSYKRQLGLSQRPRTLSSSPSSSIHQPEVSSSIVESSFPPKSMDNPPPPSPCTLQAAASLLTLKPSLPPPPPPTTTDSVSSAQAAAAAAASLSPRVVCRRVSLSSLASSISSASHQYTPPTSPGQYTPMSPQYTPPPKSPQYSPTSPEHSATPPPYSPSCPPYDPAPSSSQCMPSSPPYAPAPSPLSRILLSPMSRFRPVVPKPVRPTPLLASYSTVLPESRNASNSHCPHCDTQKDTQNYAANSTNKNVSSTTFTLYMDSTPPVKIHTFYGVAADEKPMHF